MLWDAGINSVIVSGNFKSTANLASKLSHRCRKSEVNCHCYCAFLFVGRLTQRLRPEQG
uniref:Uncharacterized protein n=1 Tax=Brassica campestris TaxID=3711 RepID=M4EU64_BRACM